MRTSIIDLLYHFTDISISTRLFAAYNILDKAVSLCENNAFPSIDLIRNDIENYYQTNILFSLDTHLNNIVNEKSRYDFLQQIYTTIPTSTSEVQYAKLVDQIWEYFARNDFKQYLSDLNEFKKHIQSYNHFYVNYWVYRIFSETIRIPDYSQAKANFIYIAAEFCLFQIMALVSYSQNGKIDKDEYIYIISRISRMMEHESYFRNSVTSKLLKENDLISPAGLLLLLII